MSQRVARRASRAEHGKAELWRSPAAAAVIAAVTALALASVPSWPASGRALWPGDLDSAYTMLQVVTGAVITVTTLIFSLTVIALQLASQQFSPRLLRNFERDRLTKVVLSVLVGAFVYCLTLMRSVNGEEPLPRLALFVALTSGLLSLAAVLVFITHVARILRVDTMMLMAHDEAAAAIEQFYPRYGDGRPLSPADVEHGDDPFSGQSLTARLSGFIRMVNLQALISAATAADVVVRLEARPGDHVTVGTPLASAWSRDSDRRVDAPTVDKLLAAVVIGYERTVEQDSAFGFRQLEDIAVKAMSPAINDPVTAIHAIGHMSDLLVRLCGRRLGPTLHLDEEGVGRAIVLDRDLRYYLDLTCAQIRRYGAGEPNVLSALLGLLRDVAVAAQDAYQRNEIERQVALVLDDMDPALSATDAEMVNDMARRVRQALAGCHRQAFADRTGETRSV
jgi:uncharacterized membrane protein